MVLFVKNSVFIDKFAPKARKIGLLLQKSLKNGWCWRQRRRKFYKLKKWKGWVGSGPFEMFGGGSGRGLWVGGPWGGGVEGGLRRPAAHGKIKKN